MDEFLEFRKNALQGGGFTTPLCADYKKKWFTCHGDKEKLMRLALMCQSAPYIATFFYHGKCVSVDYMMKEYGEFINGRVFDNCDGVDGFTYQMYFNATAGFKMASDVSQILFCPDINVEIPETKCPRLYISNRSSVHLTLNGFNSVTVYLFDESTVDIVASDENSKVTILKYSDKANVVTGDYCLGKVKVHEKELRI